MATMPRSAAQQNLGESSSRIKTLRCSGPAPENAACRQAADCPHFALGIERTSCRVCCADSSGSKLTMIVGYSYRGDDNDALKAAQHDVYWDAIVIIVSACKKHVPTAVRSLGIRDADYSAFSSLRTFDHRTVQDVHDLAAAYWRFLQDAKQRRAADSAQFRLPKQQAWIDWLWIEAELWWDEPELVCAIATAVQFANTDRGYDAEEDALERLRDRYMRRSRGFENAVADVEADRSGNPMHQRHVVGAHQVFAGPAGMYHERLHSIARSKREQEFAAAKNSAARWLVELRDMFEFYGHSEDGGIYYVACATDAEVDDCFRSGDAVDAVYETNRTLESQQGSALAERWKAARLTAHKPTPAPTAPLLPVGERINVLADPATPDETAPHGVLLDAGVNLLLAIAGGVFLALTGWPVSWLGDPIGFGVFVVVAWITGMFGFFMAMMLVVFFATLDGNTH